MITEKSINIAARLYEYRDFGRRVFGDRYAQETAQARQLVSALADQEYEGHHLKALQHFVRDMTEAGVDNAGTELRLICAAVDLTEGEVLDA